MRFKILTHFFLIVSLSISWQGFASELNKHTVRIDGHPFALWHKGVPNPKGQILLLHGRTWSSLPDFDLQVEGENLSLMDGLNELGYDAWALDARGYGATPRDATGWLTPNRAVKDVAGILEWLKEKTASSTHLFGWSNGSVVAQMLGQNRPELIGSVILYGYPIDPERVIPELEMPEKPPRKPNTAINAASDFITPGAISDKAIGEYVKVSLAADPFRVDWKNLSEWNQLDAGKLHVPVLLLQAEFDPLADSESHARFFIKVPDANKQWVVLSGGDHAALLEQPRHRLLHATVQFIEWLEK
jgi:pimeloyl-ACP methyl ester carboxylesterase